MTLSEFIKSNNIRGAIYDMDGTLTDSMGRWTEIYAELFGFLQIRQPDGFMMKVNHIPMRERVGVIIGEYNLKADENLIYSRWLNRAVRYYEDVFKIKRYMLEALKDAEALGVKQAIATASDKACAEAFIKSNNLDGYISSVTGLEEVRRPKSFPDIYIRAAEKLGIKPDECLVFEDALTAIRSAKSGGFKVCGVQDGCSVKDEEQIRAISDFVMGFN